MYILCMYILNKDCIKNFPLLRPFFLLFPAIVSQLKKRIWNSSYFSHFLLHCACWQQIACPKCSAAASCAVTSCSWWKVNKFLPRSAPTDADAVSCNVPRNCIRRRRCARHVCLPRVILTDSLLLIKFVFIWARDKLQFLMLMPRPLLE